LPDDVLFLLGADPGITRVQLAGSRASGRATARSDWDLSVLTGEFWQVRGRLPGLVGPLRPVAAQSDRLSRTWCYMLLLAGPVKVDLIFGQPHAPSPPWQVSAATLPGIDDHFWDWLLWLSAKQEAGQHGLVAAELARLHEHLLDPLGVTTPPTALAEAAASYLAARGNWQRRLGCRCPAQPSTPSAPHSSSSHPAARLSCAGSRPLSTPTSTRARSHTARWRGSDGVQHLSAVHQRVFRLQEVSETVELLEPGVGVMLAVRGMTWNLDRDGVLDHVLAVVCAERDPGDPGAEECAS